MSDEERKATLLEDIETLHRILKELQSVKGYVQIIEHALKLRYESIVIIYISELRLWYRNSELAAQQVRMSNSSTIISSVTEYKLLQEFVTKVSYSCSQVEGGVAQQTLQLVTFLERILDKTWADIKGTLSE